nr:polyhydroxyalkanoate biosynthesis repressor PhaR [Neobacillus sp. Marseille-Q6967]
MAGNTYNPYEAFKKYGDLWEKQTNEMIHLWTNNREFLEASKVSSDIQTTYLKVLQKNQESFANQLNIPTKKDLANVAKLSIQMEEKLDVLEEQIWNLQDSVDETKRDIKSVIEVSSDLVKLVKQLKSEQTKHKKELEKVNEIHTELYEVKTELTEIYRLKEEIASLKDLMGQTEEKEQELVITSK